MLYELLSKRVVLDLKCHIRSSLGDNIGRVLSLSDALENMVGGFLANDYLDARLDNASFVGCNLLDGRA